MKTTVNVPEPSLFNSFHLSLSDDSPLSMLQYIYLPLKSVVKKSEIYLMQLARTKLYHCYENKEGQRIHLSHAGFSLMANDEIPNDEDLLWDRDHIDDHCDWWPEENPNDYVVHGHTGCVSSVFKRSSFAFGDIDFNKSRTLCRYAHGHKICIDGRTFLSQTIARLDLDTLEEKVFFDSDAFPTE